jgi:hypothetical protein
MVDPKLSAMLEQIRRYAPIPYTEEDALRRGEEFYESQIRPIVEADNSGKVVAIDVETGDYGMGITSLEACDELFARRPNAFFYLVRIGQRAVHQIRNRPRKIVRTAPTDRLE